MLGPERFPPDTPSSRTMWVGGLITLGIFVAAVYANIIDPYFR